MTILQNSAWGRTTRAYEMCWVPESCLLSLFCVTLPRGGSSNVNSRKKPRVCVGKPTLLEIFPISVSLEKYICFQKELVFKPCPSQSHPSPSITFWLCWPPSGSQGTDAVPACAGLWYPYSLSLPYLIC